MPSSRGGQGFVSFETDIAKFERVHRAVRERREGRQATRYHVHGIHEYKGKFNPQVVRAFANILEFEPGETLLDPFCGSGTAVVEGLALGGDAYGIDRSPLAVLISRAKTATWRATYVKRVADELAWWLDQAAHGMAQAQDCAALHRH
jgi:site-specific DNA-methyltransferase (cytosine-N4-specific)